MKKNKTKQKNKKDKFKIYLIINSILLAWLSLTTLLILTKYDVLPLKYMLLTLIPLILIPGIFIFLMLKKNIKKILKTIISVISIITMAVLIFILVYLQKTFKFLDNLKDDGYIIRNYSVIVLKNNNYDNIEQLNDKTINYYIKEETDEEEVIKKLDEVVTSNKQKENNHDELIEKLYNNEADAILMEESYTGIIEETNPKFSEETKTIYTIEIKVKAENIVKEVNVNKDTFNIYISGIDTYGNISSVSRSDVNIIATVNPTTHQILLTTIPRDYYVQLDGTEGYYKDKLTHAGIYGIEKSIKTLENLLDIDINYYIKVNFSSVEKIIDALGGVDVYSEYTFTGYAGTNYTRGYNRVNGTTALEFARTRKTVDGGDRTRGKNQQALIQAILKKSCSKEIITKYTNILSSLEGSFQTNMSTEKITDLIKKQIDEMSPWNVTSISLDGENGSELTYSYPGQELYVMIPNEETIENAKKQIKQVENGEMLDSTYNADDSVVNNTTKSTTIEQQPEEKKEEKQEEKEKTKTEEKKTEVPTENKEIIEQPEQKEPEQKKPEQKEEQPEETKQPEIITENNENKENQTEQQQKETPTEEQPETTTPEQQNQN